MQQSRHRIGILIAAYFGLLASFASVFIYSFSVFLKPLSDELGWTRTQLSGGFALAAVTVAITSPLIGRAVDRFGSKAVILPCSLTFAAAFASLSLLTPNLLHLYATLLLIGMVGNGTTQLAYSRAVVTAFDHRRGLALATVLAGTGTGGVVMPLLTRACIDAFGWRATFAGFGAGILVLVWPLTWLLIPSQRGVRKTDTRVQFAAAGLRQPLFWRFVSAFFFMSLAMNGALTHLVPLLTDRGMTPGNAAIAASVLGAATLAGRLLTGYLLDRWPSHYVSGLLFASGGAGLFLLFARQDAIWAFPCAALIGLGIGAEADVIPYLISRHFDLASFSELYGYAFTGFAFAAALGPVIMARIFDLTGSYDIAVLCMCCAAFAGAVLVARPTSATRAETTEAAVVYNARNRQ